MALVRHRRLRGWDPFTGITDLPNVYGERMFDFPRFLSDGELGLSAWHPAVDMYEDNDNFIVKVDLPGLTKDDINISFDGHILSITGNRVEEAKGDGSYWSRERFTGDFHRYVHLPMEVSSENLTAKFTDGVLEVTLPKTEKSKVKKIPIESGGKHK